MVEDLFEPAFLHKLETLTLISRRRHRQGAAGENPSLRRGSSLEFYDYRHYQPGDDFRYIDWNVTRRLERIFVKLFSAEEDLTIHILLDCSRSMAFGRKLEYAKRVAAALGYIAIANLDRVGLTSFADELGDCLPARRSKQQAVSLMRRVKQLSGAGGTDFNHCLRAYALACRRPGLAIVISDLLDPEGFQAGLSALLYRRFEVVLIQVLDPEEIRPSLTGAFRLEDCETGRAKSLSIDREVLDQYRRSAAAFFAEIEEFCLKRRIEYLRTSTAVPFEDIILRYLRQGMYLH